MITKLEMFIALAKEQHFGRAAESLGITQPTLSSGIKALEEHLGVPLVLRGARFGGLTPEGQRALVMARDIVASSRRLRDEMRAASRGLAGQVRLAVVPTALTRAAALVTRFADEHPEVRFSVSSQSSQDILTMLENLDVDAGLTYLDNEPLGRVLSVPLYRESYTLVCRRSHPMAGAKRVGWGDLGGEKLALLTPDMQNRRIINRNFMEAGLEPDTQLEASSTVVLVSSVAGGGWVTILPTDQAEFLARGHDLSLVPIEGGVQGHSVGLVARHSDPLPPVLQALFRMANQ